MPFYTLPGVKVREIDLTNIASGESTGIGAAVGKFAWGPVDQVQVVSSENDLVSQFFEPDDDNYIDFYNSALYLSYSQDMRQVRVVGPASKNATSGGNGTGLTLDVLTTNGEVTGVSLNAAGTNYETGDLILIPSNVTNSELQVTSVDDNGAVTAIVLLSPGSGINAGVGVATSIVASLLIKNDDDFDAQNNLPEIIANYPGSIGNTISVSVTKASDFERWSFNDRFIVGPQADVVKFDGDGTKVAFTLPASINPLPADAVVTNDGNTIVAGVDAGNYQVAAGVLTVNVDTETFNADGVTNDWTLVNAKTLDLSTAQVKLDALSLTAYTGVSDVPVGSFKITNSIVTVGVDVARFSGNGATGTYTIPATNGIADAIVLVSGVAKTVVYVGVPAAGEVLIVDNGANSDVTFPVGEEPAIGNLNIDVTWSYPDPAVVVEVKFGFPKANADVVKVFWNETELHMVVVDKDGSFSNGTKESLLERYASLGLATTAKTLDGLPNYYVDAVNTRSNFIRVGAAFRSFGDKRLSGGVNDNANVTDAERIVGWNLFKNKTVQPVSHLVGGAPTPTLGRWLIDNVAETRKDTVVYYSPARASVLNNTGKEALAVVNDILSLKSTSYGHFDGNWMQVFDPYNGKTRFVPCAGASAGIYALTQATANPWNSGAGLNRGKIRNAIKLAFQPTEAEERLMYSNNVNTIKNFRGVGPVLYGDKTMLARESAFQQMNIRWTFIIMEQAIEEISQFFVFENNTPAVRARWVNSVNPFMRDIRARGGVQDYRVVADESNNTQQVIEQKKFVGTVLVRPTFSINFVEVNFVAVGGDLQFSEVTPDLIG